jgi:hypothetical protein
MLIVDKLIIGGVRFVLQKVAAAVDAELNDDSRLREELLAAQMRLELGELDEDEFRALEAGVLARLREVRERRQAEAPAGREAAAGGEYRIAGAEAEVTFDEGKSPRKPARGRGKK